MNSLETLQQLAVSLGLPGTVSHDGRAYFYAHTGRPSRLGRNLQEAKASLPRRVRKTEDKAKPYREAEAWGYTVWGCSVLSPIGRKLATVTTWGKLRFRAQGPDGASTTLQCHLFAAWFKYGDDAFISSNELLFIDGDRSNYREENMLLVERERKPVTHEDTCLRCEKRFLHTGEWQDVCPRCMREIWDGLEPPLTKEELQRGKR